jgi:hypothetical protein
MANHFVIELVLVKLDIAFAATAGIVARAQILLKGVLCPFTSDVMSGVSRPNS